VRGATARPGRRTEPGRGHDHRGPTAHLFGEERGWRGGDQHGTKEQLVTAGLAKVLVQGRCLVGVLHGQTTVPVCSGWVSN
jgi:hypothetical protein